MPPNRFRSVLVALLIAWVSMVAYALSGLMSEKVSSEDRHFAEDIDSIVGELKNKLDTNEAVLAGFAAFLQAVDRSDVEATARYASLAIAAYPHIENTLRKEWRPDFALKDFRSITHRPAVDAPKRAFTWPILFMYPALPEAAEIHGVRLETVDYLGLSLASAEGKAKPVASPVFNLYEGGNAYILLQEAIRNPVRASGTDLNFFGNTMAAMLLIKGQSLVPSRLDSAGHKYIHVSAWMDSAAGLGDPLFDHQAHEASLLDKLLLPSFERRLTVNNASQPIALQFERRTFRQRRYCCSWHFLLSLGSSCAITEPLTAWHSSTNESPIWRRMINSLTCRTAFCWQIASRRPFITGKETLAHSPFSSWTLTISRRSTIPAGMKSVIKCW